MRKFAIYALAAGCLLTAGCAKNATVSEGETAQKYLQLWMKEYHPEVASATNGVYILSDEPGTGDGWNSSLDYSLLNVTIRTLAGKVTTTNHEDVAKQVGSYVEGDYYGPVVTATSSGYAGVESMLDGMRIGGTRTAVIPSWLLTKDRYSSQKEYLEACSSSTHLIYTISFSGQIDDVQQWERSLLRQYVTSHYGADVQSVSFNDATEQASIFFFIPDNSHVTSWEEMASGTKYTLNYTGSLLNGQVFDTTSEKVAKDNGIYNKNRTYEPVTITTAADYDNYALDGSTSLVDGFKGALSMLKYPGQRGVAIFASDLGYSTGGSGTTIPGFAPLRFDLEIVKVTSSK